MKHSHIASILLLLCNAAHSISDSSFLSLDKGVLMKLHQFYKNKRVLVTGGCGFIGSHLAQRLVDLEADVTIIDNCSTGTLDNIKDFHHNVRFIQESISNQAVCDRAVHNNDIIFHLAAFISVPGSVKDPVVCHDTNVNGTFNLLVAARKYAIQRFIFSSTSAVYGPRTTPCTESDTNLTPISPYGATKLMGELYCKQFSSLFGVPCVMLRYFNVHGPRQDPHSPYAAVVAKFTYCLERNEPITIFGNGQQTRDFVHVDEVVLANLLVGMAPQEMVAGEVYNIGSGTSISILELAHTMKQSFPQHTAPILFSPARAGDVLHTAMNPSKFNNLKADLLQK